MWFFKQAHHGREVVHAAEKTVEAVERVAEEAIEQAVPAAEMFIDVIRPLERKLEQVAEEKINHRQVANISEGDVLHLLDKMGWWKDETVV